MQYTCSLMLYTRQCYMSTCRGESICYTKKHKARHTFALCQNTAFNLFNAVLNLRFPSNIPSPSAI